MRIAFIIEVRVKDGKGEREEEMTGLCTEVGREVSETGRGTWKGNRRIASTEVSESRSKRASVER